MFPPRALNPIPVFYRPGHAKKKEQVPLRGSAVVEPVNRSRFFVGRLLTATPCALLPLPLCSCFVRKETLGSPNGSLTCSRQTPAGALLAPTSHAGGRLCPPRGTCSRPPRRRRAYRADRRRSRGRGRASSRSRGGVERIRPLRTARARCF